MLTSNFAISGTDPRAVAISIGKPRGWKGRAYAPLAPTWSMLKMNEALFEKIYRSMLDKLDPEKVYRELGDDAILLCWEPFNVRCHRRLVAEWFESNLLLIKIPELGHDRAESIPFTESLRAAPKRRRSDSKTPSLDLGPGKRR